MMLLNIMPRADMVNKEPHPFISSKHNEHAETAVIMSIYKNDTPLNVYLALLSLKHQTYKDFIILVYLDGPIQAEVEKLLQHFMVQQTNLFVYPSDENKGLAFALNYLIDIVITECTNVDYIARMDADDISSLARLERQIAVFKQMPDIDILGTACQEFGVSNKILKKYELDPVIKKNIIKFTPFIHPSVVFRRRVFTSGLRYPLDTCQSEDLKFWFKLARANCRFHNMQEVLLFYRLSPATLNRRRNVNKAISDMKSRIDYLMVTRTDMALNFVYIAAQFILKFLPGSMVSFLYKNFR